MLAVDRDLGMCVAQNPEQLPPERLRLHKFGILTIRSTRLQADSTSFTISFCRFEVSGPVVLILVADFLTSRR